MQIYNIYRQRAYVQIDTTQMPKCRSINTIYSKKQDKKTINDFIDKFLQYKKTSQKNQ